MKRLCFFPALFAIYLCLACSAFCATVEQTDQALVAVESSVKTSTILLQQGRIPTRPLPKELAIKVLSPIRMITEPGVPPTPFDTSYLVTWLSKAESITKNSQKIAAYQSITQMIELIRAQVQTLKRPSVDNSVQVRALARTELSDRVYGYDQPPSPTWLDRFGDWLSKKIQALLAKLTPRRAPTSNFNFPLGFWVGLGRVVEVVLVLVAVALVTFLIVLLIRWIMDRRNGYRPLAAEDAAEEALLEARDTDSILSRANQMADSGDYRRAFRLIYLAALVTLDTDGILHFDRSRTNWEYLRELRRSGRQDLYSQLVPFTREFDRIWYGFGAVDASAYASAVIRYKDLKASMSSSSSVQTAAKVSELQARQEANKS